MSFEFGMIMKMNLYKSKTRKLDNHNNSCKKRWGPALGRLWVGVVGMKGNICEPMDASTLVSMPSTHGWCFPMVKWLVTRRFHCLVYSKQREFNDFKICCHRLALTIYIWVGLIESICSLSVCSSVCLPSFMPSCLPFSLLLSFPPSLSFSHSFFCWSFETSTKLVWQSSCL